MSLVSKAAAARSKIRVAHSGSTTLQTDLLMGDLPGNDTIALLAFGYSAGCRLGAPVATGIDVGYLRAVVDKLCRCCDGLF